MHFFAIDNHMPPVRDAFERGAKILDIRFVSFAEMCV